MEASLAATGMLEVLATRAVLFMMLSGFPSTSIVSCKQGNHGDNERRVTPVACALQTKQQQKEERKKDRESRMEKKVERKKKKEQTKAWGNMAKEHSHTCTPIHK